MKADSTLSGSRYSRTIQVIFFFFLKKTIVGQSPPATNILMKGEEPANLQRASKEAGGRGHLTSS
jgi:hypothetical protein